MTENERLLKELEWKSATDKIIKAVDSLEVSNKREEIIKIAVEYMLIKMCESEELFNDNLAILDRYASNGLKQKKIGERK